MFLTAQPASEYTQADLADLFTRGFEGYFVPIKFSEATLESFIQRDGVDLDSSRVLLDGDQPAGLALIARRGQVSRLAGMGLVTGARGRGGGSWLMQRLLADSRARGEKRMFLEVITQNEHAIKLYEKSGFTKLRRLIGFVAKNPGGEADASLQTCPLDEVIQILEAHSLPDLPWQADAVTLGRNPAPTFGFRLDGAYIAISDPRAENISVRSLVVAPEKRGQGQATRLLKALFAKYPGRTWHVLPIFPEEMASIFENAKMPLDEFPQWQMVYQAV